jgi:hypothetical protein
MQAFVRRRPSAPMVVAVIALILAASGSAIAASSLVNGDKLIKKRSLSANRLRDHTLTGRQINFKRLGSVPSAANALHANTADSATTATNAGTAINAGNANTLGGESASAFEPAGDFIRSGLVTAAAGKTTPLVSFGPFALTLNCVAKSGSAVQAEIDATSTIPGSDGYGTQMVNAAPASYDILQISSTASFFESNQNPADFLTPTGTAYVAVLTLGENYLGVKCYANALVSPS